MYIFVYIYLKDKISSTPAAVAPGVCTYTHAYKNVPISIKQRNGTSAAMLTTRLRAMFSSKGNGPWWLAVHLLEKGRQEGIKDVKVYNIVLKASRPPPPHFPFPTPPPRAGRTFCLASATQLRMLFGLHMVHMSTPEKWAGICRRSMYARGGGREEYFCRTASQGCKLVG